MANILIVDDERSIRNTMQDILTTEGHHATTAEDGQKALESLEADRYDIMFCDIKMPKMDGIEVLETAHSLYPEMRIILISGHGDIETAVECIKKGAFDFIEKPIDLRRLLQSISEAEKAELRAGPGVVSVVNKAKSKIKTNTDSGRMIGNSPAIMHLKNIIARVAPTDVRVLITGESGTGKEVAAKCIYEQSKRKNAPYVEVNCAAIPSELIESELFGHEKGSFTSAIKQRKGKFEQADGGTLFLDEIGDMSLAAQTKVLRALQENEITKVGSDTPTKVNVRVIAATNKDLKKEIEKGTFREDLYHRISVIPICIPPLRERRDDIPLLIDYFAEDIANKTGEKRTFEADAVEKLKFMNWYGNVRELRNVVERLIIMTQDVVTSNDVDFFATPDFL